MSRARNISNLLGVDGQFASTDVTTALGYVPVNKAGDTMTGNLSHTGLAMTVGNSVDQFKTFNKSLQVTYDWINCFTIADLSQEGVYIIHMLVDNSNVGGLEYSEHYTGMFFWYAGSTNNGKADDLILHRAGHAPNDGQTYLRTKRNYAGNLVMQIKGDKPLSSAATYSFYFRRLM